MKQFFPAHRSLLLAFILPCVAVCVVSGILIIANLSVSTPDPSNDVYHAYFLSSTGEMLDTFDITITGGLVYEENDGNDTAAIKGVDYYIGYPSDFCIFYNENGRGYWEIDSEKSTLYDPSYVVWHGVDTYNNETGVFYVSYYGYSIEEKYLVAYWPGLKFSLVAAADPNVDAEHLLDYFDGFLKAASAPRY